MLRIDKDDYYCYTSTGNKTPCHIKALDYFLQFKDVDIKLHRNPIHPALVKENKKREPVGLSKRYKVLSRDGFQCVLCGASGKDAKLEIDHIIPVFKGGSSVIDNLQTLCFKCNRGKGCSHD